MRIAWPENLGFGAALLWGVWDVILPLKDFAVDPRVAPRAKSLAGGMRWPTSSAHWFDLVLDLVLVLGQLTTLGGAFASLALVLALAGVQE